MPKIPTLEERMADEPAPGLAPDGESLNVVEEDDDVPPPKDGDDE